METERVKDLLAQLQNQYLHKGDGSVKGLVVAFRKMDTDFSKNLSYTEFSEGMKNCGLQVEEEDLNLMFEAFDRNKNKKIDFMELVSKLQPKMSEKRTDVVNQAFDTLDANKDGVLKMEDMKIVYSKNAKKHPKFVSGEWTEEQVLRHFLDSIDTPSNRDGEVTREEFMNYYEGVSLTVDDDSYFDLMMRACYGLPNRGT